MKLHLKVLLTLGSLLTLARACSEGCIRCNTATNECVVCDLRLNFVPDGSGGCVSRPIVGCINTDADGGCYVCDNGRYYDFNTKTCPLASPLITHCRKYTGPSSCSVCMKGYYLTGNTCVQVGTNSLIANCVTYSSATTCSECEVNFIPNINGTFCTWVNIVNCSNYRNYQCKKCDTTQAIMNQNTYLIAANESTDTSIIKTTLARLLRGATSTIISPSCIATTISNCDIYSAYNKCYECSDGYYVAEDFSCQPYIINKLSGCQVFANPSTCETCINGYFLEDGGCSESSPVDNCETYSGDIDSCIECVDTHYLAGGECSERQQTSDNCLTYDISSDTCTKCEVGFGPSSDSVCASIDPHCVTGEVESGTNNLTCSLCEKGYYTDGSACIEGTIDNCEDYAPDSNACVKCEDEFEIVDNACESRTSTIEDCETYEVDGPTRCKTCNFESVLYYENTICKEHVVISQCAQYLDKDNCETCNPGFELESNACNEIPPEENCHRKSLDSCSLCSINYNLNNGVCVLVPDQISENCALYNEETLGINFQCIGCAPGFVPVNDVSEICINENNLSAAPIANCSKYENVDTPTVCTQCNIDFVLSSDRSECLEACPEDQVQYMGKITELTTELIVVEAFAQCHETADFEDLPEGCSIASHSLNGEGNVCLQCSTGFIPVEHCSLDSTFFNINNLTSFKEGQSFSVVSCVEQTPESTFIPTSAAPDVDCAFYLPVGNKFYCTQCAFGKTGAISVDGEGQTYIDCSVTVTGCNDQIRSSSGFNDDEWISNMYGFNLSYQFTCHACSNENQIPFIHLNDLSEITPYEITTGDVIPSSSSNHVGEFTVCREPTQEGLSALVENFDGFVDNCALGLIVVDMLLKSNGDNPSIRCLACKDGFAPSYDNDGFHIESCNAIENCTASTTDGWLNGCRSCSQGFNKVIDADGKIDPNQCVSSSDNENCRIYSTEENQCIVCERGYYLDADQICNLVTFPFCDEYAMRTSLPHQMADDSTNYSYIYYFGATGFDCYDCANGYASVSVSYDSPLCALHPNLAEQSSDSDSNYASNCENYYLNENQILCQVCAENYVVSADHISCYENTTLTGCAIATNDGSGCDTCTDEYVKSSNTCLIKNIVNCGTYTAENGTLVCVSCASGHMKDGEGECVSGDISHCDIYDNDGDCTKCDSGFYLFFGNCEEIPSSLNCSIAVLDNNNKIFECTACASGYVLDDEVVSSDHTICLQGPLTDNCVSYDADFVCTNCADNYYLDQDICQQRTIVDSCDVYFSSSDACQTCDVGFILDNNTCVNPPNIVSNCLKYETLGQCGLCGRGRYLSANACVLVDAQNRVNHCYHYSSPTICSSCDSQYLLIGNTCVEKVVTACATYTSANVCATCPPNFIFKTLTGIDVFSRECVEPSTTIEFCEEINASLKSCKTCSTGYYLGTGRVCTQVETLIEDCLYYSNASTCEVCEKGTIRALDGKSCKVDDIVNSIDTLCADMRYNTVPVCAACRSGHYFNSSTCVPCSSNKPGDGCMYCNPVDNTKCLVCLSGFTMNNNGICIISASGIESSNFEEYDESAKLTSTFFLVVALVFSLIR